MIDGYGKSEVRYRKVIRIILVMCIGVLILLLGIKILGSSAKTAVLPIKKVQIFGNTYTRSDELLRMINLDTSRSLLFFNNKAAKIMLLSDRRISGVEIVKVYPDMLKIYVAEKRSRFQLAHGEHTYWMSADGIVLGAVPEGEELIVPLITLISNNDDIKIGEEIANFMVFDLLGSLKELERLHPDFYKRIELFHITESGVYMYFKDRGYRVYLGNRITEEKFEKLRALTLVLENYAPDDDSVGDIKEIDMSLSYAAVRKGEKENEL
jgi:hypothetical protein